MVSIVVNPSTNAVPSVGVDEQGRGPSCWEPSGRSGLSQHCLRQLRPGTRPSAAAVTAGRPLPQGRAAPI